MQNGSEKVFRFKKHYCFRNLRGKKDFDQAGYFPTGVEKWDTCQISVGVDSKW